MVYDSAIIGTGPAGLSAALNLKIRRKSFIWIGSQSLSDKVLKAEQISNYPGFSDVSGAELAASFKKQIADMKLEITEGIVNSVMPFSGHFALSVGREFYESETLILATGAAGGSTLAGEESYLGRGVSYCATCDGNLYRGKTVAVICNNSRFEHEVKYLAEIAEKVYFFPLYKNTGINAENIDIINEVPTEVFGDARVGGVMLRDGRSVYADGVFCLRDFVALSSLLPKLETENSHIKVDRSMATSISGVYAAGDCTGRPYQYAKAVGEGNVAAHSVLEYLSQKNK